MPPVLFTVTVYVVSCNCSSNAVGSVKRCFLEENSYQRRMMREKSTNESNTPNDIEIGSRLSSRDCLSFLEQIVRELSSSYVTFGNLAGQ